MTSYADLHCHSKYSNRPSQFYLKWINARESYTEPRDLYRAMKRRGMNLVTITDHDTIDGVTEIADREDVFISEELSCYFPEDECKVHLLVYGIDEEIHRDLQELRKNIYEVSYYLHEHSIAHSVAHPLFRLNGILDATHIERLFLLFRNFEEVNGGRSRAFNGLISRLLDDLTPESIERLADKHDVTPVGEKPWRRGRTGGSDDHTGLLLASAWTALDGVATPGEFLEGLDGSMARAGGVDGTSSSLAHSIYHGCYHFLRDKVFTDTPMNSDIISAGYITRKVLGEEAVRFSFKDGVKYVAKRLDPRRRKERKKVDTLLSLSEVKSLYREIWNSSPEKRKREDFDRLNEIIFGAVSGLSNSLFEKLLGSFGRKFLQGHLSESISSAGSLASLFTTLVPYLIASSHQNKDRDRLRRIAARFDIAWDYQDDRLAWFTDTFDEVNGVTMTVKRMVGEATARGKDITVICSHDGELDPSIAYRNFPPLGTFQIPGSEYQKIPFPSWLDIVHHCEKEAYTRLIISTPGPVGLSALVASKVLGIKSVGIFHTDIPLYVKIHTDNRTFHDIAWKYITWFYNSLDTIYIASDYYRSYLVDHGFDAGKMRIFPKAVDTEKFNPDMRDPHFWQRWNCDHEVKLLYVGRVVKEKNLDVLAKSFELLSKKRNDMLLVVVGDGPYREELSRRLAGKNVLFTGVLEGTDLSSAYASSDVFVFPSTTDTYGNAVLEAQASGLPAVVTDSGGAQEVIIPDLSGIVTASLDEVALAKAISDILDSPSLRQRMAEESRRLALKRRWEDAVRIFWQQNSGY